MTPPSWIDTANSLFVVVVCGCVCFCVNIYRVLVCVLILSRLYEERKSVGEVPIKSRKVWGKSIFTLSTSCSFSFFLLLISLHQIIWLLNGCCNANNYVKLLIYLLLLLFSCLCGKLIGFSSSSFIVLVLFDLFSKSEKTLVYLYKRVCVWVENYFSYYHFVDCNKINCYMIF